MAELIFYYGSMKSSKSAQLIMTAYSYKKKGKQFEIVKSSRDTRDDAKVKSRALSLELDCVLIHHFTDLMQLAMTKELDVLFVDEVQFMTTDMIDTLAILADEFGIKVICYGLLTDFQSNLFEGSQRLVACADTIREIESECVYCEKKANRNMRVIDKVPVFEGETIVPGDEQYISVCRKCFNQFKQKSYSGEVLS